MSSILLEIISRLENSDMSIWQKCQVPTDICNEKTKLIFDNNR